VRLDVRPASLDGVDIDIVLDLLAEAAAWTAARGHANWPPRFSRRSIERYAAAGDLYVAEIDGVTVATVRLQWDDPRFWGDDTTDGRAGYVHRLVVRRSHGGVGLGARMLTWADEQVLARGRALLRLDVVSHNAPLRAYYEAAGFAHVRDVTGEWVDDDGRRNEWRTSLYERPCE